MPDISTWKALLEIAVLALLIYSVLAFLRGSRGAGILRGVGTVLAVVLIISLVMAEWLELNVLRSLIQDVWSVLVVALIVIFQPELRGGLVRLGQNPVFTSLMRERWDASNQITRAVMEMSRERTGALIALQQTVGLKTYIEGGVRIGADVTAELLITLFRKGSPLHDGAAIINGDRIIAAACLFPLSENPNIDPHLGTRHRAGVGVTEESDAVVLIVSEETGEVSIARQGAMTRNVDEKTLRRVLHAVSSEEGFQQAVVGENG